MLTTHYNKLCKKIKKLDTNIENYYMIVDKLDNNDFKFTYKLKKGINKTKGGNKILKDLNYPEKIINS